MSAPPRSTVMLPRLTAGTDLTDRVQDGSDDRPTLDRKVPVGPGGGKLLSNALCMARVELPRAVCAHLRRPFAAPLLTRRLGLARALVAIARQVNETPPERGAGRALRLELDRVAGVPEGDLVQELTARLESIAWPDWVPLVGIVMPLGSDIAISIARTTPPAPPKGISCPLLAARVVSAIRGPVFLRDAAPALSNLLNLWSGATPSGTWEVWLPVAPGTVRPLLHDTSSTNETNP